MNDTFVFKKTNMLDNFDTCYKYIIKTAQWTFIWIVRIKVSQEIASTNVLLIQTINGDRKINCSFIPIDSQILSHKHTHNKQTNYEHKLSILKNAEKVTFQKHSSSNIQYNSSLKCAVMPTSTIWVWCVNRYVALEFNRL